MVVGGLQRSSLSDFPGLISAIVFTRGCGFRCPYCHNPELVDPSRYAPEFPLPALWKFLRSRRGLLKGVVVTGGEPTTHADLPEFLAELKDMGFAVKLDTNGTNPRLLLRVMAERLVDFIAMDIKAPPALYAATVNAAVDMKDILRSIELVLGSGLPHEFRTTWVPSLLTGGDILAIAGLLKGCDRYVLQSFRPTGVLDPSLESRPPRDDSLLCDLVQTVLATGVRIAMR